jgi:hypothetical protein
MVSVSINLYICVLCNKTANSSDTSASEGCLMSDEWNKKNYNDRRGLIWITFSTFSRMNWGQSRVPQSGQTVICPTFSPISCQLKVRLVWVWNGVGSYTFKMAWILKFFRFSQGVREASFPLECDATSLDTLFLMFLVGQWSENVGRRLCTDAASRYSRTEIFCICLEMVNFGVQ